MKMSLSGLDGMELDGSISRCYVDSNRLVLELDLEKPLGWSAGAHLTRGDVFRFISILVRNPRAWAFLLFGVGAKTRPLAQ